MILSAQILPAPSDHTSPITYIDSVPKAFRSLPDHHKHIVDENGNVYDGGIRDGKKHGFGTTLYANGDKYEGMYVNGVQQGFGTFVEKDGSKYRGYWRNNQFLTKVKSSKSVEERKRNMYSIQVPTRRW